MVGCGADVADELRRSFITMCGVVIVLLDRLLGLFQTADVNPGRAYAFKRPCEPVNSCK